MSRGFIVGAVLVFAAPGAAAAEAIAPAAAERVLAAVARFEARIVATMAMDYAYTAHDAIDLIQALDRDLPPALADRLVAGVARFYSWRSGVGGYATLCQRATPERRAKLLLALDPQWRANVEAVLRVEPGNWSTLPDWPRFKQAWPALPRGASGPVKSKNQIDLPRVRREAVFSADLGACFDLAYAAYYGADTLQNEGLFHFWGTVAAVLDPVAGGKIQALTPGTPPFYRALADVGCRWGMVQLAIALLPADRTVVPPGEARRLLETAAAKGYPVAQAYLDWRNVRELPAPREPIVIPRLDFATGGRTPEGGAIRELPAYATPVTRVDQLAAIIPVITAGIERALADQDPVALTRHLGAWSRQWEAAFKLWEQNRTQRLAQNPVIGTLTRAADAAWAEGRFGTALLGWLARDRYQIEVMVPVDRELFMHASSDHGWAKWRRTVAEQLGRVMPALEDAALAQQLDALPPWSPAIRHPREVFFNWPRPVLEPWQGWPVESVKADALPRLVRDPSEVRFASFTVAPPATLPPAVQRGYREDFFRREQATPDYARLKKERADRLAQFTQRIAALEQRVQREVPMLTKVVGTRQVQAGTEVVTTSRTGMPFDRKGVKQGDIVMETTQRPVYKTVTDTITVRDENHPLVKELEKLKKDAGDFKRQPEPTPLTGKLELTRTAFDRWSAEPIVPVRLTIAGTVRALNLTVPMTHETSRAFGTPETPDATGAEGLRRKMSDPAKLGAAEVHRAVATLAVREQLAERLGAARAEKEAALVAELLFGIRRPDGGVISLLRELHDGRPSPIAMSAPTPVASKDPGAPAFTGSWPVPAGAEPSARVPAGPLRLVHDPAAAREAQALVGRLKVAGLELAVEARALPRGNQLFPILAFAGSRSADVGVFLWHAAPMQMAGLHSDSTVPAHELRLHAGPTPPDFANGMVWMLAHPARVAEARALEAKIRALGGAAVFVDISVSWRGVIGPGRPARTLISPEPESRLLADVLAKAGLADAGPVGLLAWPRTTALPPDFALVLRAPADAPAQGLAPADLKALGAPADDRMLIVNGSQVRAVAPQTTAKTSLGWW
ncbi:MAG: hypothetical protein JNL39_10525 [Opitutaceae bacterium]|nr:hypothetical protein [Opitutaceae bacterium]